MPFSDDGKITRRTALAALGTSAVGIAISGMPRLGADDADRLKQLLPNFREESRSVLKRILQTADYSGQISADDAAKLAHSEHTSIDKLMVDLIPFAQSYSHAPISNFYVGVIVRGASGNLYTGANIEIPGQCLGFAVHAEQSALSNAYMHDESGINALAVGGAPCGHCRQFIEEMSPDGEIPILTPGKPPMKLSAILPSPFSPAALGMKQGAFPIRKSDLSLSLRPSDTLLIHAADAARKSYAPYSKSPAGVAIQSSAGRIYKGSYIENVAFNPSLSPLQVALAALIAGGESSSAISACTLVEVQNAKITQASVTETVLAAIAPSVKMQVVRAPF